MKAPAGVQQRMLTVDLSAPEACSHDLVGGKGANLGRLSQAGFPVPPGFVVSTAAYREFLAGSGLAQQIAGLLDQIDYENIAVLEARTATIRELIADADVSAQLVAEISDAYERFGSDRYVAVRSSGTAEDLEGTSFAGLHDTYLDVLGAGGVLKAVKDCWGSLWTARATTYRQRNEFAHLKAELAVVVQLMVESDVSGVMFTANPRTGATDETVIDASWGLGEAVVQGIVTPDEYLVKRGKLLIDGRTVVGSRHVLARQLGSKALQIRRNPETGRGTVTEDVASDHRAQFCLSDEEVVELAALGRRVSDYYDEYPQDLEWALADSQLFLLQSRPITGVEFSWDEDVNANVHVTSFPYPPQDPNAIRTRAMADEGWTGAITPLMFSWRANQWNQTFWNGAQRLGREDLLARIPTYYYKGYSYWDCEFDRGFFCEEALPSTRAGSIARLPAEWHEQAQNAPFSIWDYVKQLVQVKLLLPAQGPYSWFKGLENYINNRVSEAEGLPDAELPALTDEQLEAYIDQQIRFEEHYNRAICLPGLFTYFRDAMVGLALMVDRWYTGENPNAFTHLVTGTPRTTATIKEHFELAKLAATIRNSPALSAAFRQHKDDRFFAELDGTDEGRALQVSIDAFLAKSGHRGHADRDIYYTRYSEDSAAVYAALEAHLKSEDDPEEQERHNTRVRQAAYDDVVANLRGGPLGFAKAEAFKLVHAYVMQSLMARDDERQFIDRNTFSIKKGFLEVNRRLLERELLETERDFYFLGWHELFDLLHGRTQNHKLLRWKIEGRMRNFDRWDQKLISMPKFLVRNQPMQTDETAASVDAEGRSVMRGFGTSGGEITATARVIRTLKEIGRVNKGEIMITNSTDPGWTPVFAALSGVIVETGGLLSHSGCLAREYGFPAAHIDGAVSAIPDGATITLNGDGGWVRIEHDPDHAEAGTRVEGPPLATAGVQN